MTEDRLIIALRCAAILLAVSVSSLLWWVLMRLSWQVDCLIALAACALFAYKFERQDVR